MKVVVMGATGYAGAELLRLLTFHPHAEVVAIASGSHAGENISAIYPHLRGFIDLPLVDMQTAQEIAARSDFLFIALPSGHAMQIGKALANTSCRIIDLGADYRFADIAIYETWYKNKHVYPEAKRVYGLAELYRKQIHTAKIVGNAGCYTTASILALAPLAGEHLIKRENIIVDAKSGLSGAGRSAKQANLFAEQTENFQAYAVAGHRHTPEIEQALTGFFQAPCQLTFTPHLVPMARGILATCYANLAQGITAEKITAAFQKWYGQESFVRLLGLGGYPATKHVRGSNLCEIGWHVDMRTKRVIVLSAIDNLLKGAAGQAVQNFNIMNGWDEATGLQLAPLYP